MEPLLADPQIQSYDVIALQEPWQNPLQNRTYCPGNSGFISAYDDQQRRCCFLINRRVDNAIWNVHFPSPDLAILNIRTADICIWIYNVYSEPPGGYNIVNYPSPIPLLQNYLQREGEHMVLGDFNLHHLL